MYFWMEINIEIHELLYNWIYYITMKLVQAAKMIQ